MSQYTWSNIPFTWSTTSYTWNDIAIVQKLASSISSGVVPEDAYNVLSKPEQTRVIELICIINGHKTLHKKKITKSYKVTAKDIKFLIEKFKNYISIDVTVSKN